MHIPQLLTFSSAADIKFCLKVDVGSNLTYCFYFVDIILVDDGIKHGVETVEEGDHLQGGAGCT